MKDLAGALILNVKSKLSCRMERLFRPRLQPFSGTKTLLAFDVATFTDKNGKLDYVWATSWGVLNQTHGGFNYGTC